MPGLGLGLGLPFWRPVGAALTPLTIFAGRVVYRYDSGDAATLWTDTGATTPAGNGDGVARADDGSGNGRFIQQASGAARPTRNTGLSPSVLAFGGSQRLFASATFGPIAQPYSIFVTSNNGANSSMFYDSGTAGTRQTASRGAAATTCTIFAGAALSGTVPDMSLRRSYIFEYNGASSKIWYYDSGTEAFVTAVTGNAGANTLADMRLGGNTINFLVATEFCECFAVSTPVPTAQERADYATYVKNRWNPA